MDKTTRRTSNSEYIMRLNAENTERRLETRNERSLNRERILTLTTGIVRPRSGRAVNHTQDHKKSGQVNDIFLLS